MFKLYMEAALPKLSQTSLYEKMNNDDVISNAVKNELSPANVQKYHVSLQEIEEIIALMKLNGDISIKKALKALETNDIIILFHKDNKSIPGSLPYIVIGDKTSGRCKAFVFADKVMTNLNSQREYTNLMATIEAAYFSMIMYNNSSKFVSNRALMQVICNIYAIMVTLPLEQKVYMKGEHLTKAMLYAIAYFYRIIDGPDRISINTIPYKKIISDKVQDGVVKEIFSQVASMEDDGFMGLIRLIQNINPLRYKDLEAMYLQHFVTACGMPVIFALENPSYLFMLIFSSVYKTQLTQFNLNKTISGLTKKASTMLGSVG